MAEEINSQDKIGTDEFIISGMVCVFIFIIFPIFPYTIRYQLIFPFVQAFCLLITLLIILQITWRQKDWATVWGRSPDLPGPK